MMLQHGPAPPGQAGLSSSLSPVVERPDRHLSLHRRLRAFAARPAFRGSPWRAALRIGAERARAGWADLSEGLAREARIRFVRPGRVALAGAPSVAIYVHYAPVAAVSRMVIGQVERLRDAGFAVVFVSMAPGLPPAATARLEACCAAIIARRNHGLDFGAWHDVLPLVLAQSPAPEELLLVNDSLCGPFGPVAPALASMRAGPGGLYGLTENLAPSPHLQSYFLLARGRGAVADVAAFLARHRVSADKRRTIREGEVRLSRWMRARGHAVSAWCGYERVEAAALRRAEARRRVRALLPHLFAGVAADDAEGMRAALRRHPLNATHLFWRELVLDLGFPFVKTDLLLRNPLGIADRMLWRSLLAGDAEAVAAIEEHLAILGSR